MADLKTQFRILLVYPGLFMQTALPLSIACLSASLKKAGMDVKIFDTVLYQEPGEIDENEERATHHHSTRHLDYDAAGLKKKHTGLLADFEAVLKEYKPSLIGISTVESTFGRGLKLARHAKSLADTPIIMGGVFPTLAPEIAIAEDAIDIVCVGEGEDALVALGAALNEGKDYTRIPGLWVKSESSVNKNAVNQLQRLDDLQAPDFSGFDRHMFYKPMQGNLFKTIPVELSRGCPYQCTYCAEPSLKRLYQGHNQAYFRKKSMPVLFREIRQMIQEYEPQFFYFATETFLAMSDAEFDDFVDGYRAIRIPFWVQTRPETIRKDRIVRLQEVGMFWITIGIESGNEEFRKKHLKRQMSNEMIERGVHILNECGQGASLNSIIGFPHETRELMFETIMLNRKLYNINPRIRANISLFTPFRGCEMYDESVRAGLFEPVPYLDGTNISGSVLSHDTIDAEGLAGIYRTIPLYIYLPDEDMEQVRRAEMFTDEGNALYEALNSKVSLLLAGNVQEEK